MGISVTGISSLTTEFGVSPVHWDWTDSPVGSKYEMVALIVDNFMRILDLTSPTFDIIQYLFACVCFHCTYLEWRQFSE